MKISRTKNALRNTAWGIVYRITTLIGPFAVRTLIIYKLGLEYSGLNSLFTSILTVLNLTNLGFSSALVFTMYKAVEEDDIDSLCAMLNFYKKVYKIVGVVILLLGLCLVPFLPHLINGSYPSDINLYVIYIIYLLATVFDYLLFAYNNAIFSAYQRNDVILKVSTVRYIVQYLLQSVVLLLFANYYIYIILLPLMVIPNNLAIYKMARKMFPNITCKGKLDDITKKNIFARVGTLFGHKLGSTVLVSVDSVIISAFLNLSILSIYGNYYYILTGVNGIVEIVTNGSLAGIGNKLITDSKEDNYQFFKNMTYGWISIIGFAAAFMLCLYQPFIGGVWLGKKYLLDNKLMILIVVYFYAWMFRIMQLTFRDAAGLWVKDWLKPYVGMVLNLVGSILMVKYTNSIVGVLLPTIIVMFFVYTPWEIWALFKFLYKRSSVEYVLLLIKYTLFVVMSCGISYVLCEFISPNYNFISFVLRFFICGVCYGLIWVLLTGRQEEYKYFLKKIRAYLKNRVKK